MTTTAPPLPPAGSAGGRRRVQHSLGPFTAKRPPAAWGLRVLATLLDSALVASVVFLATGASPSLAALPGLGKPGGTGGAGWTAGTLLALAVLQAYTGMTPGKRVAQVAVVDDRTGRPIGLPGTVLRWFAHLLDALLLIGYLRSAFRRDGRTFADSLLGTVAVRTTSPEAHPVVRRLRAVRDARAPWLRVPRRVTGALALVLCAASAAASLTAGTGGSQQMSEDGTSCVSTGDVAASALFGTSRSFEHASRLGITRVSDTRWEVGVGWSSAFGVDSARSPVVGAVTAALAVTGPDGTTFTSPDSSFDGIVVGEDASPEGDGDLDENDLWWTVPEPIASTTITTDQDVTGWTARAALVDDDGTVLAECSAPVPTIDAGPVSP
ncbi:RDD family protein [Isoptericola sp. F-RaC21]|uniref:RDD family protein n=1 Tax=Isoptericola sp. F-RaC21 TaxID=3141452 RepID=UPI00315BF151